MFQNFPDFLNSQAELMIDEPTSKACLSKEGGWERVEKKKFIEKKVSVKNFDVKESFFLFEF